MNAPDIKQLLNNIKHHPNKIWNFVGFICNDISINGLDDLLELASTLNYNCQQRLYDGHHTRWFKKVANGEYFIKDINREYKRLNSINKNELVHIIKKYIDAKTLC